MPVPYRYWLTRVGGHLSAPHITNLNATLKYLEIGRQVRSLGYRMEPRYRDREELFDIVGREVGERKVLYLEFGVYQGQSTRYWSKLLRNPESMLHGFDSFEGLPEAWTADMDKGHFSTDGAIPVIDDPRVSFFKGWFDQTLENYQVPSHEVLVLNMDADLYSSTKCVFDHLARHILPGTYLYFDEFNDPENELRAFAELSLASKRKFKLRGATETLQHVLFECTE